MTAAHCIQKIYEDLFGNAVIGKVPLSPIQHSVLVGTHDMYGEGFRHFISGKIANFNYDWSSDSLRADTGLIYLLEPIELDRMSDFVERIYVPGRHEIVNFADCKIVSWGAVNYDKVLLEKLQMLNVTLSSRCYFYEDTLCSWNEYSICDGDSGGAVICSLKGKPHIWRQVGVNSFFLNDTIPDPCRGESYFASTSYWADRGQIPQTSRGPLPPPELQRANLRGKLPVSNSIRNCFPF